MSARVARRRPAFLPALSLALVTGFAAASESPTEVDASSEPECPRGWTCVREAAPARPTPLVPREPAQAPPRLYPLSSVAARAGWIPMPPEASVEALLFGGALAFRYRAGRMLGLEIGPGLFLGRDFLGRSRTELSAQAALLLFGASRSRPGPFVSLGPSLSLGWVEALPGTLTHLGGHLGFGAQLPASERTFALVQFDVFARGRLGAAAVPEYVNPLTGATADGDVGAVLWLGFGFDVAPPSDATR